jgi:2,3-bisphosphoglycerate-independent phosphoglycerate mutase
MDRDNRWDRVELAYRAMAAAQGERADDAVAAIAASYGNDLSDEFMLPTIIGAGGGMQDGDGLLMANFRADRAREILAALVDPGFDGFERQVKPEFAARLGMVEYSAALNAFYPVMFGPIELHGILGQVVSEAGLRQLRIAETEKYAHVTFFLNGGREEEFDGEERVLIPSPRIATYDLQPEMSAVSVTDSLVEAIEGGTFDLIVVNYANGDMVGHTGILAAAVAATTAVDVCLGRLETAVRNSGGVLIVTADHGNCEMMASPHKPEAHTAHTTNPVPILTVNAPDWVTGMHDGRLCDVAPTVLKLMGLEQPAEMTGQPLLNGDATQSAAAQ